MLALYSLCLCFLLGEIYSLSFLVLSGHHILIIMQLNRLPKGLKTLKVCRSLEKLNKAFRVSEKDGLEKTVRIRTEQTHSSTCLQRKNPGRYSFDMTYLSMILQTR